MLAGLIALASMSRYSPLPSAWRPGALACRTRTAVSTRSGCRRRSMSVPHCIPQILRDVVISQRCYPDKNCQAIWLQISILRLLATTLDLRIAATPSASDPKHIGAPGLLVRPFGPLCRCFGADLWTSRRALRVLLFSDRPVFSEALYDCDLIQSFADPNLRASA